MASQTELVYYRIAPAGFGNWPPPHLVSPGCFERYKYLYKILIAVLEFLSKHPTLFLYDPNVDLLNSHELLGRLGALVPNYPQTADEMEDLINRTEIEAIRLLRTVPSIHTMQPEYTPDQQAFKVFEAHKSFYRSSSCWNEPPMPVKPDLNSQPAARLLPPATTLQLIRPFKPLLSGSAYVHAFNEGYATGYNLCLQFSNGLMIQAQDLAKTNIQIVQELFALRAHLERLQVENEELRRRRRRRRQPANNRLPRNRAPRVRPSPVRGQEAEISQLENRPENNRGNSTEVEPPPLLEQGADTTQPETSLITTG